jgi:hypothetical protein
METIPSNFHSIIIDFTKDLSITFSEYSYLWEKWTNPDLPKSELLELYQFCVKIYPERFFDILYQKDDMFNEDNNVEFLPNVNFKLLFSCQDLSEITKKTIWKYLQLILFTIIGSIKDKASFGDTANLFEGIDEAELNNKLNETMTGIIDFFKNMENIMDNLGKMNETQETQENDEQNNEDKKMSEEEFKEKFKSIFEESNNEDENNDFKKSFPFNMGSMPNIEKIQEHLKTLFEGKIGKLAKEMAEEISGDFSDILGDNPEDLKNPQDVIKKLMKDPKKVMDLMKSVGGKLDSKMKSGEISREELMKEASEMLQKMKDMGGTDQFNEMFKNMSKGMGMNMGKNAKVDTNALDRMSKMSKVKERIKNKINQKKLLELQNQVQIEQQRQETKYLLESKDNNSKNLVFKLDGEESQEKSFIHPDILKEIENEEKEENKKNIASSSSKKKKKNKK